MQKNPCYVLRKLCGVPYLLPFGQGNAELRRGVQLDESGVFLWEALDEAQSERELAERFLAYAGANVEEAADAEADVRRFLDLLRAYGILLQEPPATEEPLCMALRIGALRLALHGKAEYFSNAFAPFADDGAADILATQTVTVSEAVPGAPAGARLLLANNELSVYEGDDGLFLRFPGNCAVLSCALRRDGGSARLHVCRPGSPDGEETLREELFHAVRHAFLYFASRHGYFALHSASILYRGKAWLFSAPSGTGKSTQAALWRDACDAPCLNGDLNLLSARDGSGAERAERVFVHGLPWCGTSEISTPGCTELGGVILLRQGAENRLEPLREDQKQLYTANRLISPAWTQELLDGNLAFAGTLAQRAEVWRYLCTKDPDAVAVLRGAIDRTLDT